MNPVPPDWLNRLPELVGPVSLDVAGYTVEISLAAPELEYVYLPTLACLDRLARSSRVLAGLAGVPGSGKSTFAAALARLADRLLGHAALVPVGIDGWHLPNAVLDRCTTTDESGRPVPLSRRKGSPASFDAPALAAALRRLAHARVAVRLPAYDRNRHDPVPDAILIPSQTRIVLLEGNYLLDDDPPWNTVASLLFPVFFLACDARRARRRVLARHVRGGDSPEQARQKYRRNDKLNARAVLAKAHRAFASIPPLAASRLLRPPSCPFREL